MIRVAVIAPAMTLRVGLREVLGTIQNITVVAEAAGQDEIDLPNLGVDVLVLTSLDDLRDLDRDALPPVLLLTDDPADASALVGVPSWGVLPVNASEEELGVAIHALSEGLVVAAPTLLRNLLRLSPVVEITDSEPLPEPLTGREVEVLQMIAQGMANKQIAVSLGITEHTVKFHLSSVYAKLGVTSRTEAVRSGARRGLVVL